MPSFGSQPQGVAAAVLFARVFTLRFWLWDLPVALVRRAVSRCGGGR